MRRLLYLLPFALLGVACIPPFRGPSPVPIPSVVPAEVCQHHVTPGYRYTVVIPQKGVWGHDWVDSQGHWFNGGRFWFEQGQTLTIETAFPFHVVWAPDTGLPPRFYTVSSDVTPVPAAPCPDF